MSGLAKYVLTLFGLMLLSLYLIATFGNGVHIQVNGQDYLIHIGLKK